MHVVLDRTRTWFHDRDDNVIKDLSHQPVVPLVACRSNLLHGGELTLLILHWGYRHTSHLQRQTEVCVKGEE